MQTDVQTSAKNIIEICRRVYDKGFVAATDGNISVRLESGNILATPTAVSKGFVQESELIEVDLEGNVVSGTRKPSTELAMHLYIYKERPDINAVVHCHPPFATGFATAGLALDKCVFPEVVVGLGAIPLAQYATPSTREVVESIAPYIKTSSAFMLANHGVVTTGADIFDAYFKMEKVDHAAHITLIARLLGGERVLTRSDVEKLEQISQASYGKEMKQLPCIPCEKGDVCVGPACVSYEDRVRYLVEKGDVRTLVRDAIARMNL